MFNKTTSLDFALYGEILNDLPKGVFGRDQKHTLKITNKTINRFYCYDADIYVFAIRGIILLMVSEDETGVQANRFVIHRVTKIKKGIYFNFIALSDDGRIEMLRPHTVTKHVHILPKAITYTKITQNFQVKEIYAYYYQVRNPNYSFLGESHHYWELTYVDNGTLQTTVDDETFLLNKFDLILYAPKQFHDQKTISNKSCSYMTVVFDMNPSQIDMLLNRVFHCQKELFSVLKRFIEASNQLDSALRNDMLLCYLKELIIQLMQYDTHATRSHVTAVQQRYESELLNEINIFLHDHIAESIAIDDICRKFSISRTGLQELFKDNVHLSPKNYINELKLQRSKQMIKEDAYSISEIALKLGFTTIHYFSRKFKQRYGMTPTAYAKSVYN